MPRQPMRTGAALLAGGLALGLAVPTAARAQDAARMEAIERQIRALQSELTRMRRDMQARESETRAAKQEAAQARSEAQAAQRRLDTTPAGPPAGAQQAQLTAAPPADQVRLAFERGRPTMTSGDGRFQASLGGQFQYDIGGSLQGNAGVAGSPAARLDTFGQNLRRGRLFFGFKYDDFQLNVTPDFGGSPDGTPSLYEANLNWSPLRPLTLTLGYYKPYFGLADSMSSNDFLFLERPSIMEIARNVSGGDGRASLGGRWAADRWFVSAYFTGDSTGSNNTTQSTTGQTGFVGRIAGRPYADADTDVHLGFTGSHAFDLRRTASGQTLQLRDRPELRIDQTRLIDTGALNADSASTWGPEFGVRWRNFMLQGEYQQISVEQAQAAGAVRPDLTFEGGYVEGSWVITGEPRRYSTSSGAFGRPNPAHPFDLAGGGWGAWEAMARYSVADLNDRVTRGRAAAATGGVYGGRQEVVGMGLSWYPNNYLRFMLNWDIVNVDRLNAAGVQQIGQRFHTVALRTQLAF
ncbi:porin [Paracraurococcus lichenis]|uniref:Porin n=1 Tax=Paracraurococcus lichenis TaxID=3064888 RepID=A0ABT9DZG9_9PROT|nr:porin [Paracraurococcus sp. LOR1-02]MDO9709301.1 porin [Paracraurococcus sp. LOR1-02]